MEFYEGCKKDVYKIHDQCVFQEGSRSLAKEAFGGLYTAGGQKGRRLINSDSTVEGSDTTAAE